MRLLQLCSLTLVALAVTAVAQPAHAGPVTLTIENIPGFEAGFGFSALHSASGGLMTVGGNQYFGGGSIVERPITGAFIADLTGSVLTITSGTINPIPGSAFSATPIAVTGGTIDLQTAGQMASFLDTDLGTFWFLTHTFAGAANSILPVPGGAVSLWGNNWNNTLMTRSAFITSGGNPLGIDLRLRIDEGINITSTVPEPSTWALFGLGTLALGALARRRRRRAAGA